MSRVSTTEERAPVFHAHLPLSKEYYVKSSAFGYAHVLPDLVLFFALLWGIGTLSGVPLLLAVVAVGVVAYRMTFIVHDCGHGTLFATRAENEVTGWMTASLLLLSFPSYRRLHWMHHQHYRRADDPQGSDYNGLVPGRDRILRHLLAPPALLMVWERLGTYLALNHCGMSGHERAAAPAYRTSATPREHALSGVAIAAAQIGVAFCSTAGFSFLPGYPLYLLSLATVGLFLSRLRSYLEHGNLTAADADRLVARTHVSNVLERNLLSGLFFNYHHEHHVWPQVPSRLLLRLHQETAATLSPDDLSRTYVASLRRLAATCREGVERV